MSNQKVKSKRFVGVYFRESDDPRRTHNGKRDKCFSFCYRAGGKLVWETAGWSSEGMTEPLASQTRADRMANTGKGPEAVKALREKKDRQRITFGEATALYWTWAESEGKHVFPEKCRYEKHIRETLDHLPMASITQEVILEMKTALLKILTPQSARHVLSLVRRIFGHAIKAKRYTGTTPFGPHSLVSMPTVDNDGERFLTPDEGKILIEALRAKSRQMADMAMLALSCGLRACEVFAIKGGDLDADTGLLYVTAKGGNRETVHAPPQIVEMLLSYDRAPDEYVFQGRQGGKLHHVSTTFRRVVMALGLDNGTGRKGRVWFHTCRHSFASELAKQPNATIPELKAATRHKRLEMLDRYLHTSNRQLKDKIDNVANKFLE